MASRTLISVEEYLRTSYRPDCDYVDGEVLERNVGETDHSWLQTMLSAYLVARRAQWGITVLVEQRVQVTESHFRVPDICVLLGPKPTEQVLTKPRKTAGRAPSSASTTIWPWPYLTCGYWTRPLRRPTR
jgi:hypothetical protein